MHRAYPGRPCPGGGRDLLSPANPDAVGVDGHLHHEMRPGLSTGALDRAINDGQSLSVPVTRETMRSGTDNLEAVRQERPGRARPGPAARPQAAQQERTVIAQQPAVDVRVVQARCCWRIRRR